MPAYPSGAALGQGHEYPAGGKGRRLYLVYAGCCSAYEKGEALTFDPASKDRPRRVSSQTTVPDTVHVRELLMKHSTFCSSSTCVRVHALYSGLHGSICHGDFDGMKCRGNRRSPLRATVDREIDKRLRFKRCPNLQIVQSGRSAALVRQYTSPWILVIPRTGHAQREALCPRQCCNTPGQLTAFAHWPSR